LCSFKGTNAVPIPDQLGESKNYTADTTSYLGTVTASPLTFFHCFVFEFGNLQQFTVHYYQFQT
jgi:hypothetical protein